MFVYKRSESLLYSSIATPDNRLSKPDRKIIRDDASPVASTR